jgi:5-hydroxyisourate hydrolase-like protein (transthyretin family)
MDLVINVIDGMRGYAAEGINVNITYQPPEEPSLEAQGLTDSCGNFTFSTGKDGLIGGQTFMVQLALDSYFTSLGLTASYKQIALLIRVPDIERGHMIRTVITPSAHATYHTRTIR